MAVVKMGQIKSTPSKAIAYITRADATNDGLYVSTNAAVIDPSDSLAIAHAMQATTARVGITKPREGSVLAHHVIQSFDPTEAVTPENAHRIGQQLAERITGGAYEYVIATHMDKDHVHNHIIFNAVNMDTGRKYRVQKGTIGRIRTMNDELCREAGLRVLPPHRGHATGRSFGELYAVIRGESYKHKIRTEIDKATQVARNWDEFAGELRLAGIEVRQSRGQVSYRDESSSRTVRDWRLGEPFTEQAVMSRLAQRQVNRIDIDRSMIVTDRPFSVVVKVPGTRGAMTLTVPKDQIVQHGRTMRAYIPNGAEHVLASRTGSYRRSVKTEGLYEWFSRPSPQLFRTAASLPKPLNGRFNPTELHTWRDSLTALHQIEAQVNARARWAPMGNISEGEQHARDAVDRLRGELSAQLVALSELADDPGASARQLDDLRDSLRGLDLRLEGAKRDAEVLGAMQQPVPTATATPTKGETLQERIQRRAAEIGDDTERARGPQERQAREARTEAKEADFIRDREGGDGDGDDSRASAHSLKERIAEKVKLTELRNDEQDDGRSRGWRR